jgi:hypothetical protein
MHSIVSFSRVVSLTLSLALSALLVNRAEAQTQDFYRQGDSMSVRISNGLGRLFGKGGNSSAAAPQQPRYQYAQPRQAQRAPQQSTRYATAAPQAPRYKQAPTTVARSATPAARSSTSTVAKAATTKSKTATVSKAPTKTTKSTVTKTAVAAAKRTTKHVVAVKKKPVTKAAVATATPKKKSQPISKKTVTKKPKYEPPAIEQEEEPEVASAARYVSKKKESSGIVYAPTPASLQGEGARGTEKEETPKESAAVASASTTAPGISPFLDGYAYVGESAAAATKKNEDSAKPTASSMSSVVSEALASKQESSVNESTEATSTASTSPETPAPSAPQEEPAASSASLVQPKVDVSDFPVGTPGSAEGLVKSPYPPHQELDVTDMASGALALDPTVNKVFRVP